MTRWKTGKSRPAPYVCIVKIKNRDNGSAYCVKYHTNSLTRFTAWLDHQWPVWKWYNVFCKRTEVQLASFTNRKRPSSSQLQAYELNNFTITPGVKQNLVMSLKQWRPEAPSIVTRTERSVINQAFNRNARKPQPA